MKEIYEYEHGLPEYLQHDLDMYKEGLRTNSNLLDCYWGELYGSINGAEIDKNSKENKGKVTKKVCKTIDNKMIKFYTTMQQRWKKYIDKISGQGEA